MADVLIEQIYKALRLIPEFDGNSNVLTRFIKLCDVLVEQFIKPEAGYELSNLSLINGILNKIVGPAARTINSNGIPENWDGIRSALINNFADQRDETSLYNDLALLSQGSASPSEYYEQCNNLFSTIMTYISLHETIPSTIESKRSLYKKLTLQAYLRGLRDPLGSRIRCMRPDTIEKALEYVHEEMNTLYFQQRNEYVPDRKPHAQPHSQVSQLPKFPYGPMPPPIVMPHSRPFNFPPVRSNNMPGPSRQFAQPSMQQGPTPGWKPQAPQFRGPSRTQQMFAAPLPNYRPQGNAFQFQPSFRNSNNTGPKPMSGVSHFVSKPMPMTSRTPHDWSRFGNPPPSNYFKTREMNFNESYDTYNYNDCFNDHYPYEYYYHPDYYMYDFSCDQPNFTEPESYCVEETQDSVDQSENEDFQKTTKSDKLK